MAEFNGCTFMKPVGEKLGASLSEINFVTAEVFSLAVAIIFRSHFSPDKTSVVTRHIILISIGLLLGLFCFGSLIWILIGQAMLCYVIILCWPRSSVHGCVFVVAMAYLFCMHLFRFIYEAKENQLDITGPLMICTQKLTMLGFGLSDGQKSDQSKLTDVQRKQAVRKTPALLEFLSYVLHFQSVLVGPGTFYNDFIAFVEGRNITTHMKKFNGNENNNNASPSPKVAVVKKLTLGVLSSVIYLFLNRGIVKHLKMDDDFISKTPFLIRIWYGLLITQAKKSSYYTVWLISDAVCNASGFGFSRYDEHGLAKWDGCTIVDIWNIEMATGLNQLAQNWHITAFKWLRYVSYDRLSRDLRRPGTIILSAVWHGLSPCMYIFFLHIFAGTLLQRVIRRNIRPIFQQNDVTKFSYAVITWFGVRLFVAYVGVMLFLPTTMHVWRYICSLYWYGHVIAAFLFLLTATGFFRMINNEVVGAENSADKEQ